MAKSKIIEGLKDAVRHARCVNRHVDHHVTSMVDARIRTVECMKCKHKWREEDRYDGREPFTHTTFIR